MRLNAEYSPQRPEHLHSAIRFVTRTPATSVRIPRNSPAPRRPRCPHSEAPERWSRATRNWNPILIVTLNPEHESAPDEPQSNAA